MDNKRSKKSELLRELIIFLSIAGVIAIVTFAATRPPTIRNTTSYYEVAIQPRFGFVNSFSEGLAAVGSINARGGIRNMGFIDERGRWVIRPRYDGVSSFSYGLALVRQGDYLGLINRNNEIVVPIEHEMIQGMRDGMGVIGRPEWTASWHDENNLGIEGIVNADGLFIPLTQYSDIAPFSEGLAVVYIDGLYGFIDREGNEVIPLRYDWAGHFREGRALFQQGELWGFVDTEGNEIIPAQFERVFAFSEGLAPVQVNGLWGYIDRYGTMVIPPQFDQASDFSEGLAAVAQAVEGPMGYSWGYIDRGGNIVIPFGFDAAFTFNSGVAFIWRYNWLDGNRLGGFTVDVSLINRNGEVIIPFETYSDMSYSEGLIAVQQAGRWGFIDITGREVVPLRFEHVMPVSEGMAAVQYRGRWGFIRINQI